ncbi:MAG: hypothetical protein COA42_10155 [Alteromonadaceae bacterium]|nr:MAG: hypothetical protein COA42_10155 [Alteromonadaceae bacterium]
MKNQRVKAVALSTAISASALFTGAAFADKNIDAILHVGQTRTVAAQKSQQKIDKIADETANILQRFKTVNKEIAGLRVYNSQLDKQTQSQLDVINKLEESIANVTVIERQIQPLIIRMLDALERFVELDVPLYTKDRQKRVQTLRDNLDRADISVAEKFRQVLEAYSIEAEYGRKLHTYSYVLEVGGQERKVTIFAVGRISVMYQTEDAKFAGVWNQREGAWEELDAAEYRSAILQGIKIAKKQASQDIMQLPILAPEAAQ